MIKLILDGYLSRRLIMKLKRISKIILTLTALVLTVCMISSCGIFNIIANYFVNSMTISGPRDFESIEYKRPDFEAVSDAFDDFLIDLKSGKTGFALQYSLSDAYLLFNEAQTMYNIAEIKYYINVNDASFKTEKEYCAKEFAKLRVKLVEVYGAIVDYNQSADLLPTWTENDFNDLRVQRKLYDDEYIELMGKIAKIQSDYMEKSANISVTFKNETLLLQDILDKFDQGKITPDEYLEVVSDYYKNWTEVAAPLYIQLIKLNNRIAEKAECGSYQEYAYRFEYSRDYLPTDTVKVYDNVKKYIPKLYRTIVNSLDREALMGAYSANASFDHYTPIFNQYFATVSPDMKEAFAFMQKYHLSCIGNKAGMQAAGFTTYLPSYEMPFLYLYTQGSIDDISSFIHEFGHFYAFYKNNFESDSIIDVSEIHSQANELLFLPYYDFKNDDEREQYALSKIADMYVTVLEGCLMDEFQREVYENIDSVKTAEDINKIFKTVADTYSYADIIQTVPTEYIWAGITHNFVAPFYYISYAMSALPAIQIYSTSLDDANAAIRIYRNVLDETGFRSYLTVLKDNGLTTPFDKKTYTDLVKLPGKITKTDNGTSVSIPMPYAYLGLAA